MPDFAQRVAAAFDLPFAHAMALSGQRPEQKTMANRSQQARHLDGVFNITGAVPAGPQAKQWLSRLVDEGVIEKTTRPVRYRPAAEQPMQGSLFG